MRTRSMVVAGSVAIALAVAGGGVALAGAGDDEATVTGPQADAATAAALEATGGGRTNAVERDSENGATWEVEVTRPDRTTADVRVDDRYRVVVIEDDSDAGHTGSTD